MNNELGIKIAMPLTQAREIKNTLILVVASDRGLAGAFNTQVLRTVENFFKADGPSAGSTSSPQASPGSISQYSAILIGKKAASYISRRGIPVIELFTGFGDYALPEEVEPA